MPTRMALLHLIAAVMVVLGRAAVVASLSFMRSLHAPAVLGTHAALRERLKIRGTMTPQLCLYMASVLLSVATKASASAWSHMAATE